MSYTTRSGEKIGMTVTFGKCKLGISDGCYEVCKNKATCNNLVINGEVSLCDGVCGSCIYDQTYVASRMVGAGMKSLGIPISYYQKDMTFRGKEEEDWEKELRCMYLCDLRDLLMNGGIPAAEICNNDVNSETVIEKLRNDDYYEEILVKMKNGCQSEEVHVIMNVIDKYDFGCN